MQYTAIRYAERPTDVGAIASIGTAGDFDNALADTVIALDYLPGLAVEEPHYSEDTSGPHPRPGELALH